MTEPGLVTRLIHGNNATWWQLYYDEVVNLADCQLAFVHEAGVDGYYNCAHAVRRSDAATIETIERFFAASGLRPAVYLDPDSPLDLGQVLGRRGYAIVPAEEEQWYMLDMAGRWERGRTPASWLKIDPERVTFELIDAHAAAFPEFVAVDAVANELPHALIYRLCKYPRERAGGAVHNRFVLARVDGVPAVTGSVGVLGPNAYLAEAGTLPEYRRMGLYSALMQVRLEAAAIAGCTRAVLTCSPTAHSGPASARFGFEHVWTRMYMRREIR